MNYEPFLHVLISNAIADVRSTYGKYRWEERLNGALAGCSACMEKTPHELKLLLQSARLSTADAKKTRSPKFWWYRAYEEQVGWICNVVSCWQARRLDPQITVHTTVRGFVAADNIEKMEEAANG